MIDLDKPALHARGVTVFADHADPRLFHYLPDAPRLRAKADGSPELALVKYTLDPTLAGVLGAGGLSFTVELAVDDDALGELSDLVRQKLGVEKPVLAPIVPDAGTVELVSLEAASATDGARAAKTLGGAAPSLFGSEAATFFVALGQETVALVEGALRGGGLPIGVVYALRVNALRPALRATLHARWADIYDYYENRLHGGKLLFAVDVGATMAELQHQELFTVTIDELLPPAERDGALTSAVALMQSYVLEKFFKPTLGQAAPADGGGGALATVGNVLRDLAGFLSLNYTLQNVHREELKTLDQRLDAASAETLTLSPQGSLSLLVRARDVDALISKVDASTPPTLDLDVGTVVDLAAEEIDHVSVTLTYGADTRAVTLDRATARAPASFAFDAKLGPSIAVRYAVGFLGGAGVSTELASPDRTTTDRVVRVDPRELYDRVEVRAVARAVPWDRVSQVLVDLRALEPSSGWRGDTTLTLDEQHPELAWSFRATPGGRASLERRLRYLDPRGAAWMTFDWDTCERGVLVVGDPAPPIVDVRVLGSAEWGSRVRTLVVELRPTANVASVTTIELDEAHPSSTWSFAPQAGADRAWEYRVTIYTTLSEVQTGPWTPGPTDAAVLRVGPSFYRLRPVTLTFLGKTLAAAGVLAVKARFQYDDDDAGLHVDDEVLVRDAARPISWAYPLADPSKLEFRYTLTFVRAPDGQEQRDEPVTTTESQLVRVL